MENQEIENHEVGLLEKYSSQIGIITIIILSIALFFQVIENNEIKTDNGKLEMTNSVLQSDYETLIGPKESLKESEDFRAKLKINKTQIELEKGEYLSKIEVLENDLIRNIHLTEDVESIIRCKRAVVLNKEDRNCEDQAVFSDYPLQ